MHFKNTIKSLLACLAGLLTCATLLAQGVKPLPSLHVEGKWLVDTHGNHVVLHGVMDTPSAWFNSGRWGWSYDDAGRQRCISYFEKLFTGLETAKCTVFRLHLEPAWTNDGTSGYVYSGSIGQPSGTTGEADISHFSESRLTDYMKSLYFPLMQRAMRHGMYVVVRPPGVCPGDLKVGDYYQRYLKTVWDIVTRNDSVRKYAGQISIELANEPVRLKNANNQEDAKALHDYFQPIVETIRNNGFTGVIWVPGTGWQSSYADYAKYPIEGYNIGYAVHDYDGWYGCEDKKLTASNLEQAKKNKIKQFRNQVPVVDTNPVIITEVDWSPKKPGSGHYNEHNEWVESNYGTWATGRTSMWGTVFKAVHDHYGNISMTLSGTGCLLDVDALINTKKVVPAFDGLEEACGKACMDWYAEYYQENWPRADFSSVPVSDRGGKYQNPIIRADFPDPDVIRVGNTYYMVSTTMHHFPGATILKSQDMVNWQYCTQPLLQLANNDRYNLENGQNAYAAGMWACSMKYHNGKFYLLINGNDTGGWLLTTTNPEGTWQMKKLSRVYDDPGLLFDNGKVYIACGINHIMMCELDEEFNFKREKKVVVKEDSGLEGCHLYKRGDYYYIYATYGGWPSGQTVFRSKDIFGPYEEQDMMLVEKWIDNVPNTLHQGALIEDTQGKWWTIMQEDLGCLGRMPNLQPVTWKNDWPVVGNNGKPYASYTKPKAVGDNSVKRLPATDNFRSFPIGRQWEWNHNPDNSSWSLFERPGWLRLKTSGTANRLTQARNTLTQRIFSYESKPSSGTVRLDVSKLQEGDRAGICILQDPYAMVGVEVKEGKHWLFWRQDTLRVDNNFTPNEEVVAADTDSIVYLRATIDNSTSLTKFYYSLDNKTWVPIGGETKLGFNLTVFVGARYGLFCYASKTAGGMADFDWFSTEDDFNEADIYPALETQPDEKSRSVTKIVPAKRVIEGMVGGWLSPGIKATFLDKHTEYVTPMTNFQPEEDGIVEFQSGQLFGVSEGSTLVRASYTDVLGNQVDTSFTARVSYFPFDPQYISTSIVGQGTYRQNSSNSVFKFSENGQMGWVYPHAVDMSDYKYLVIKLYQKQTADVQLNIYPSINLNGACYTTGKFGDDLQIVIDLEAAKYTSKSSKGKPLNRKNIRMVTFSGAKVNKLLVLTDIFLSNDSQYDSTGIVEVNSLPATEPKVDVRTLSGLLVRHGVSRREAVRGLPVGIYIVGNRKVIIN